MAISTENWMSRLAPDLRLDELSIPGTHDSGTAGVSNVFKGVARCQNFGIARQLSDGVRFLDIRLTPTKSKPVSLQVYHGIISCNLSFESVLNECRSFLKRNPEEVIIMLVNAAESSDSHKIEAPFLATLDRLQMRDRFFLGAKPGTLESLRGKIVLFRRFTSAGSDALGVDLSEDWPDDSTGQLTNSDGLSFDIEDHYTEHNTKKKWNEVEESLARATADPADGTYHLTYNSISAGGHTPYQYAWGGGLTKVNPKMNPTLDSYLAGGAGTKSRFGCVITDFYNNEGDDNGIVEKLIEANF